MLGILVVADGIQKRGILRVALQGSAKIQIRLVVYRLTGAPTRNVDLIYDIARENVRVDFRRDFRKKSHIPR